MYHRMSHLRGVLPGGLPGHCSSLGQVAHEIRRLLVLPRLRGRLPNQCHNRNNSIPLTMSRVANDDQTRQIFLSLAESLEDGKSLPTEILITYSEHPETPSAGWRSKRLATKTIPPGSRLCCGQRRTRTSRSCC